MIFSIKGTVYPLPEKRSFSCLRMALPPAKYLTLMHILGAMTNTVKKSPGTRRMNAFPTIVLLVTFIMVLVVYFELL